MGMGVKISFPLEGILLVKFSNGIGISHFVVDKTQKTHIIPDDDDDDDDDGGKNILPPWGDIIGKAYQ